MAVRLTSIALSSPEAPSVPLPRPSEVEPELYDPTPPPDNIQQSPASPPSPEMYDEEPPPSQTPPPVIVIYDHERPEPEPPPPKRFAQATLATPDQVLQFRNFLNSIAFLSAKRGSLAEIQQKAKQAWQHSTVSRGFSTISSTVEELRKELIRYKPLTLHCKAFADGQRLSRILNDLIDSILFTQCPDLTQFPADLPSFTRLTTVAFEQTSLVNLPAALGNCTSLTELRIADHQLTQIPSQISRLTHLTSLTIQNGCLKEVPPELSHCSYLITLDLSDNQLATLPLNIDRLFRLEALHLNANAFLNWPPFWRLHNLKILTLSQNTLKNVPATIRNMLSLRSLQLQHCGIQEVTPHISDLTNLEDLNLSGNQLRAIPPELGKCSSLRQLNIANNEIRTLPPLRQLQILDLTGNPIIPVNPHCHVVWQARPAKAPQQFKSN